MKKIVHLTTVHTPFDQRIFHRECVSLVKAGYEVSLLAYGEMHGTIEGVRLVSLGKNRRTKPGMDILDRMKRTRMAFNQAIKEGANLYHFHDPELISIGIDLKRHTKARVVYDCHEDNVAYMIQKKYIPALLRRVMAAAIHYQENRAAKLLDAIVTADESMRQCFLKKGAGRTICVDNYPRLDLFLNRADEIVPEYDIVYHGTIPKYHLETCFAVDSELLRKGMTCSWLFIGKCPDVKWAKDLVQKRKAEDRIVFKDPVPHEEIAKWVRLGRIGIIPLPNYPKFQRNIPTKLFEFMALKMPVVLSNLPPSRTFVGDGRCAIMVDPDSPAEYAAAINNLLQNQRQRIEMGAEGHRRVVSEFNWEISSRKLLELYAQLLTTES